MEFYLAKTSAELEWLTQTLESGSYLFFPHWSFKIPAAIYNKYRCVIFHMTDLPYGRGGSPLQNLIMRGHKETQISALRCVEELDAGPIYLKRPLSLEGRAQHIFERAAEIIEEMIVDIVTQSLIPVPQAELDETALNSSVFKRRRPEESDLSNVDTLEKMYDTIRMMDAEGYPLGYLETASARFSFHHVEKEGDELVARVKITAKQAEKPKTP
ncbi:MAG: methionyl-tRNA formyltransferase [Cyanobacteria bacterium]|nr:methionyl-tRNA formyltransferase [Cyanobacteriota bacterium]